MVRNRITVTEFHAAREHAVVFAGGYCVHRLFQCIVTGTAGLGMMDRSLSLHTKPVSDLDIRGQIVGSCKRACLSMEIEIHVPGIHPCIFHCLKGGIPEHLAFCKAICLRVVNCVHERRASHSDDGDASHILAQLSNAHRTCSSLNNILCSAGNYGVKCVILISTPCMPQWVKQATHIKVPMVY